MKEFVRDHAYRIFDGLVFLATAGVIVNGGTRYWLGECADDQQSNIYVAVSAVSATLLGFMMAALTILLMLNTGRLTRSYQSSGLYAKTLMLFHESAVWFGAVTVATLAGLFIDPVHGTEPVRELEDSWIWLVCGIAVAAAWRFFYSLYVLRQVMRLISSQASKTQATASCDQIPPEEERTAPL